ncbi:hypothetical protein DPMN_175969 [Dreissena polymorpha]|uniref:Uncharacterized protein n=1 Tax=Dreissena polymorpha TaxID=45954 RepID=A0A9D4EAD8_DREPO|nr:hypothetical protein DPMN_175969 [Dreissena polymorpha]
MFYSFLFGSILPPYKIKWGSVAFAISASGTRLWEVGTGLDDLLVGDFFIYYFCYGTFSRGFSWEEHFRSVLAK